MKDIFDLKKIFYNKYPSIKGGRGLPACICLLLVQNPVAGIFIFYIKIKTFIQLFSKNSYMYHPRNKYLIVFWDSLLNLFSNNEENAIISNFSLLFMLLFFILNIIFSNDLMTVSDI